MRVALNLLFVAPGVAGGRVYGEGLLRGLAAVDLENEYVAYTRRDTVLSELPAERFRQVRAPVGGRSTVWRTLWEYSGLPWRVRQGGFGLFHALGGLSPAVASCPFVLTVHDLISWHFPQSLPLGHRWFVRWVQPAVARRAERVIVPSRASARDVAELLGVAEERIRVVPYGCGNGFEPVRDSERIDATLKRLGVRRPYVISVARAYAHKNLAGLLRAFARLRELGHRDVQLVLVGDRYRAGEDLPRLSHELGIAEAVVLTGYVQHEDLNALYSGAAVFAFPSLAEGFGLPVLEAMACELPVVASSAAGVAEAVGDAGLLTDVRDPDVFARQLARALEDEDLRAQLGSRGVARAREFTWERCAKETLAVYKELV